MGSREDDAYWTDKYAIGPIMTDEDECPECARLGEWIPEVEEYYCGECDNYYG